MFMSPKTIHYKGCIPERKYYNKSLTLREYRQIAEQYNARKP